MPGFRRRRPIARMATGAATAGIAYNAGKKKAGQQQAAEQPQPEAATGDGDEMTATIEKLAKLHAEGALTDEEFAAAKAKALGI